METNIAAFVRGRKPGVVFARIAARAGTADRAAAVASTRQSAVGLRVGKRLISLSLAEIGPHVRRAIPVKRCQQPR